MPTALPRAILHSVAFSLAIALPLLWPLTATPDAVIHHQLLALGAWGVVVGLCAGRTASLRTGPRFNPGWPAVAALAILTVCVMVSAVRSGSTHAGTAFVLMAAGAVAFAAARRVAVSAEAAADAARAWWIAGVLCTAVAAVQYFYPAWADGTLVASTTPGRAVGNMRQPNHLATALLCAIVMTAWLWQARRLWATVAAVSIVAMVAGVAMSASRTGALSLGVLLLWAGLDRRLPRGARWCLALTPLVYLAFWAGLAEYAALEQAHFYGADRLQSSSDISSSRFAIWKNTFALIAQHPWTGVGWGRFNFAWTFTPFPDRPIAFFDHTHNLVLQLAVEIGIPATLAVLGLLLWALWRARGAWRAGAEDRSTVSQRPARAALVMLVVLAVHSLLEYPLWYAYFLLPGAWVLGVFLGADRVPAASAVAAATASVSTAASSASRWPGVALKLMGVAMVASALFATWDHRRIEEIFAPSDDAGPLAQRIAEGQRSPLFGHHADYAAVTNEPLDQRLASFRRPLQQLVDVRLLIAYIEALKANGRDAEALYAAQRLREFRRDDAQAYFKDCASPTPPFQCDTRPVPLTWRDLLP